MVWFPVFHVRCLLCQLFSIPTSSPYIGRQSVNESAGLPIDLESAVSTSHRTRSLKSEPMKVKNEIMPC